MEMGNIFIEMEQHIKKNFKMTKSMVEVKKFDMMGLKTKENIVKARNMEEMNLYDKMALIMRDSFLIM